MKLWSSKKQYMQKHVRIPEITCTKFSSPGAGLRSGGVTEAVATSSHPILYHCKTFNSANWVLYISASIALLYVELCLGG